MAFTTLISTDALTERLADPGLVIVDCRFRLDDVAWGEREWESGHIPGAVYAHLDRDLSGAKTGANGRHPLPEVAALAHTFGRLGITGGRQVVAYDQDNGMFASRLWWLLRWLGHDAVAVLDGGFARWVGEDRPRATGGTPPIAARFQPAPRAEMVVGLGEVASHAGDASWRLVDARAPERYRGEVEPLDRVPGHIPSATNYFFQWSLDERGTFRPPEELRSRLAPVLADVAPDHVICYCGSGVQACHDLLALAHAGISGPKLYPGSWSEWSSDPLRPVETTSGD
jgi:thiosulfate/3-mercaptopyruvate sulfurtransferase